jgi:hypothetical protein
MVNVSKKRLPAKLKDRAWRILLDGLKRCRSGRQAGKIAARWLSEKELVILEKRLAIKVLADTGMRHNEIKRIIDVSSHTITAVKRKIMTARGIKGEGPKRNM